MLSADVIVVGGGVAGCSAALAAARRGAEVALLTKIPDPEASNTRHAQGGIVYDGPGDSADLRARDILAAGGGEVSAAALVAEEGPRLVRELLVEELAVPFDRDEAGVEGLRLTREAAHSVPRILHHGDSTGKEIQRALTAAVEAEPGVTLLAGTEALELVVSDGRCVGVHAAKDSESFAVLGGGVVLATGGLGALYEHTTNPPFATGDGVALAVRAGAKVRDLHYVQFHPTALYEPDSAGGCFLISEAVRGEGGTLVDPEGREFVDHPAGSLAPRDVVAREIRSMMDRTGSPCAYLDITHRSRRWLVGRFPTIYARCLGAGVDMAAEPVPVVPAAHYSCGGVATDLRGRTCVEGLWAAGEVASTGLHGANRLASTSLLEGLVFGRRAGEDAARPPGSLGAAHVDDPPRAPKRAPEAAWRRLRRILWERAGIARSAEGLRLGLEELSELETEHGEGELRGPLLVARTLLEGALADARSRGCHHRIDTAKIDRRRIA